MPGKNLLIPVVEETIEEKPLDQSRLEICSECTDFKSKWSLCGQCGCYLPLKTKFQSSKCPIGKW